MTRLKWGALTVCAAIVVIFLGGCSLLTGGLLEPVSPEPVSAEAAAAVLDGAQSYFDEMKAQGKDDAAASMSLVAWLRARPEIRSAAVTFDPTIVEFVFRDGTPGLFFGGAAWSESGIESTSGVLEQTPVILARSEPALKEALILDPFPLFIDRSPARVRTALESIGYRITYKRGEQADLAALRRIHEYGVVMFSTHGGMWSGQVVLLTGEKRTDENWDAYRALRESGKIGVAGHSGQFWKVDRRQWWFVTPAFFENSPTSQRSLFYAYACYSLGNETMAEALRSSGVAVYYGWRRTVYAWTCVPQRFFRALCDGKTVAEADVADACDDATYVGDGDLVLVHRLPSLTLTLQEAAERGLVKIESKGGYFGDVVTFISGSNPSDVIVKIRKGDVFLSKDPSKQDLAASKDLEITIPAGQVVRLEGIWAVCLQDYKDPPEYGDKFDVTLNLRDWGNESALELLRLLEDYGENVDQDAVWEITNREDFPRPSNPNSSSPETGFVVPPELSPVPATGTIIHFDLDYRGSPPNSDGNDQWSITVAPGATLTLFFRYNEGNAGNHYVIRVYPEWDKTRFIANSDDNEAPYGEVGQEIGGFRWDKEAYTVPSMPGSYKIRVVYSANTTPPTWDRYDKLLAEGTITVKEYVI